MVRKKGKKECQVKQNWIKNIYVKITCKEERAVGEENKGINVEK